MSAKRPGKFMASLVLAIVLCLLLISGGCSDSSNDGGSAGKLVNYVLSKEFTAQEVAEAIKNDFSNIPGIDVSEMIATSNAVKAYSIEYYTTDINGELIIGSGLVAFLPQPTANIPWFNIIMAPSSTIRMFRQTPTGARRLWGAWRFLQDMAI